MPSSYVSVELESVFLNFNSSTTTLIFFLYKGFKQEVTLRAHRNNSKIYFRAIKK